MSITSILGDDLQSAAVGIGEVLGLMGSIALGVLLGTLVMSPRQFGPAATGTGSPASELEGRSV